MSGKNPSSLRRRKERREKNARNLMRTSHGRIPASRGKYHKNITLTLHTVRKTRRCQPTFSDRSASSSLDHSQQPQNQQNPSQRTKNPITISPTLQNTHKSTTIAPPTKQNQPTQAAVSGKTAKKTPTR